MPTDAPKSPASRLSKIAGSTGAVLMMLSALAHSLMGWPQLQEQLAVSRAPDDLVAGLRIGWHFGGVAMLAFGAIVWHVFWSRARHPTASAGPAVIVTAAYLLFGVAALVISGFDPFFLVFIVPGSLVLIGVLTWQTSASREGVGQRRPS